MAGVLLNGPPIWAGPQEVFLSPPLMGGPADKATIYALIMECSWLAKLVTWYLSNWSFTADNHNEGKKLPKQARREDKAEQRMSVSCRPLTVITDFKDRHI